MTDPHRPDLDELASAHLDGTTSPEDAARLAADPVLRARVERLREIQAAIRAEPPVDEARRESAIAAALAAFAEEAAEVTPAARATVTPLAPRRAPSPRANQLLRIAAVVILVALLVPLVLSLGDGGGDDEASFDRTGAAIEGANDGGEDTSAQAGGEVAPESDGATLDGADVPDLGSFDDLDALARATSRLAEERQQTLSTVPAADSSTRAFQCRPDVGGVRATATVAGEPVVVVIGRTGDRTVVTVLAADDCTVLDEREP
jgi:hypothetical protein